MIDSQMNKNWMFFFMQKLNDTQIFEHKLCMHEYKTDQPTKLAYIV